MSRSHILQYIESLHLEQKDMIDNISFSYIEEVAVKIAKNNYSRLLR